MSVFAAMAAEGASVPWQAHPEVWFLVVSTLAIGWFASKVVQPKAIELGYPAITRTQKIWFGLGVAGTWLLSDWPIHDIAEEHLYLVHMFQHLGLSMILPAMFGATTLIIAISALAALLPARSIIHAAFSVSSSTTAPRFNPNRSKASIITQAAKLSPHEHVTTAFGFFTLNPPLCKSSL